MPRVEKRKVTWRIPVRLLNEMELLAEASDSERVSDFAISLMRQGVRNWDPSLENKRGSKGRTPREKVKAASVKPGQFVDMQGNPLTTEIIIGGKNG